MYKVKEKTEWDEERQRWKIPPFIIKQKEVQLPKLGGNAKSFINEELENQELEFAGTPNFDNSLNHNTSYENGGARKRDNFSNNR